MEFAFSHDRRRPSGGREAKPLERMKKETAKTLRAFLIELAIYAVLVVGYFFLVLHFLGDWLHPLETCNRYTYGAVAILLIIGQAVVMEGVPAFSFTMLPGRWAL